MAPPPEYDKEPKAPDKSVTNISTDDSKVLYNLVKDQQNNSDHKTTNAAANTDVENNKHVGGLDDGQLRALLDEAIAYKRPKDREGKSSLFKELLEEVELDEQACEAAARNVTGRRGTRAQGHGRRALPHSNSLQDLMAAALAAEPPRQRAHAHPPPASVSARAHHGGSLPSGVDTSFMMNEEPARGGYLATVRCVNPPPLAERRVSASDANAPTELEHLNRRSKPMFPITYTARATLEIGSSSVCSGRAVTTTTPSNQITHVTGSTCGPPERLYKSRLMPGVRSRKMMNILKSNAMVEKGDIETNFSKSNDIEDTTPCTYDVSPSYNNFSVNTSSKTQKSLKEKQNSQNWINNVAIWYKGLNKYFDDNNFLFNQKVFSGNVHDFDNSESNGGPNASEDSRSLGNTLKNKTENIMVTPNPSSYSHQPTSHFTEATIIKPNTMKTSTKVKTPKMKHSQNTLSLSTANCTGSDRELRTKYEKKVKVNLVVPLKTNIIPTNVRPTTISVIEEPLNQKENLEHFNSFSDTDYCEEISSKEIKINIDDQAGIPDDSDKLSNDCETSTIRPDSAKSAEVDESNVLEMKDMSKTRSLSEYQCEVETENCPKSVIDCKSTAFSQFVNEQQKLLYVLECSDKKETNGNVDKMNAEQFEENSSDVNNIEPQINCDTIREENNLVGEVNFETNQGNDENINNEAAGTVSVYIEENYYWEPSINSYIGLSAPFSLDPSLTNITIENATCLNAVLDEGLEVSETEQRIANVTNAESAQKSPLPVLLIENVFQSASEFLSSFKAISDNEIDATIPFSCITTPEVVASCNTTSSTTQSAVAVDPKPLQLGSCYRAVTCLTGEAPAHPRDAPPDAAPAPRATPANDAQEQPRSVVSSSLNGLPLSRPGYGAGAGAAAAATSGAVGAAAATAAASSAAADDCKKSLDENGNSVQGFSSPLSGSSHNKKPRRKKSSKNETVIKSQEIDGYQGNKDLNEVLRFIESNAETTRGHKVRAKHKDDDEKGKKRSTERRKDKENKMKRASSLEELSRTKLEDLTDKPAPRTEPAKAERRSWGEDAREPRDFYPETVELTDFQTVTKKRKPKRRNDEPEPPRRARLPAPPSDRSNDSNDDMDSVHSLHSLPPDAAPARPVPPPQASYADIARTPNNIPDLIESCNFYESEAGGEPKSADPPAANVTAAQTGDDYPVLDIRKKRDKPRPPRKERPEAARAGDCPAPDVVSDRRPAVILLDCSSRPRDMDGVTFGFDINEQLVGGARRPRCDLVRDALEGAIAVAVGSSALRYLPPHTKHDATHLHQIVDYVGAAWEDAVRCGAGKVRYYSE